MAQLLIKWWLDPRVKRCRRGRSEAWGTNLPRHAGINGFILVERQDNRCPFIEPAAVLFGEFLASAPPIFGQVRGGAKKQLVNAVPDIGVTARWNGISSQLLREPLVLGDGGDQWHQTRTVRGRSQNASCRTLARHVR